MVKWWAFLHDTQYMHMYLVSPAAKCVKHASPLKMIKTIASNNTHKNEDIPTNQNKGHQEFNYRKLGIMQELAINQIRSPARKLDLRIQQKFTKNMRSLSRLQI